MARIEFSGAFRQSPRCTATRTSLPVGLYNSFVISCKRSCAILSITVDKDRKNASMILKKLGIALSVIYLPRHRKCFHKAEAFHGLYDSFFDAQPRIFDASKRRGFDAVPRYFIDVDRTCFQF